MKLSHPFIAELKRYVANQNATLGPIVMNLCHLIQINPKKYDEKLTTNYDGIRTQISEKQGKLSQVTDMIHAAHVFHRCVRDTQLSVEKKRSPSQPVINDKRLHQDNVMSLLVGDYLLAQSSVDMADLRYPRTVGLIAKGLEDYTRGEFLKQQLVDKLVNVTISNKTQSEEQETCCREVAKYAELTCGSLLSNACLSAALLAGYDDQDDLSRLMYSFGFHTGSAHRLNEMLYCPDTNNELDGQFIERLDAKQLDNYICNHLNESVDLLHQLPSGEKRGNLLDMLNKMKLFRSEARPYKKP